MLHLSIYSNKMYRGINLLFRRHKTQPNVLTHFDIDCLSISIMEEHVQ